MTIIFKKLCKWLLCAGDSNGGHGNSKCDFSSITVAPNLLSYKLDDPIQTNEEGIWKFEFDVATGTPTGIRLTQESGNYFDNWDCTNEVCTSKTAVEASKWTVEVKMLINTKPMIKALQIGVKDYCEGEIFKFLWQ